MDRYKILGLFWGPVVLAVALSLLFYWHLRPDLRTIRVPSVPQGYREIPQVSPEKIRYIPREPVISEAFLLLDKPVPPSPRSVLELKAVLKIGQEKICKIDGELLKEGQKIGPFKIVFIGDNYVELYGRQKKIRLLVGEKLSF
ncbi:hypothetical protein [Thermosulfurimonas dismutans]|nr:hypothetical protein [Thermosulfurimonas dismutans]